MAYATVEDIRSRMTRELSKDEETVCEHLLDDAELIIDSYDSDADDEIKQLISCKMVIRMLGDGESTGVPVGATQGSMSALGYSQSWTIGGGTSGELYLTRLEKKMLGIGNHIGSHSPLEDRGAE